MSSRLKVPVHLEVAVWPTTALSFSEVEEALRQALSDERTVFANGTLPVPSSLSSTVRSIDVCDLHDDRKISFWQADLWIHLFRYSEQGPDCDYLEGDEEIPAAEQWELPNILLKGLWDSIVVDDSVKTSLVSYCCSSILFADAGVDPSIISWNKMVLLHGPPGTGKTSLCKALAQKVYIRNSHRYQSGLMFEVNAHSLFSKWFSESGKLVMKLFNHIAEVAHDSQCLVTLLIDEVESIANARSSAQKSGEPGDAVRVVNAVLTSLDQLKRRPNVLVLCTSNMVSALDAAFLDRLDLKIHLGNPNHHARRQIIESCLRELEIRRLIVSDEEEEVAMVPGEEERRYDLPGMVENVRLQQSMQSCYSASGGLPCNASLDQLVEASSNLSGRALRKLPLQAHAHLVLRTRVRSFSCSLFTGLRDCRLDAVLVKCTTPPLPRSSE